MSDVKKLRKVLKTQIKQCDKMFSYGKYQGLSYKKVCKIDPKYCEWLMEQTWFDDDYEISTILLNLKSIKKLKSAD